MNMEMKYIWVSPETWKLCKLASIRDGTIDKALSNAIVDMLETGTLNSLDYELIADEKNAIKVTEGTWYLVDRFKRELGFKNADQFVFAVITSYLLNLGLSRSCLLNILETL